MNKTEEALERVGGVGGVGGVGEVGGGVTEDVQLSEVVMISRSSDDNIIILFKTLCRVRCF